MEGSGFGGRAKAIKAPEFPEGLEWLNVSRPLEIAELRGRVVLLDFWTYCCINCLHVLEDLRLLEEMYADNLVVIGVHSGKFINERSTEAIRHAVLRHGIDHPVVNDRELELWKTYGIGAWPTLVIIDPEGYVVGAFSGEGHTWQLDQMIGWLVERYKEVDALSDKPLPFLPEKDRFARAGLSFPGKVLADEASGWLFIADTGNHRVVLATLEGEVRAVAGSGQRGMRDGSFQEAMFCWPQGLAYDHSSGILFVADTGNHRIRQLDLARETVSTAAGTGKKILAFSFSGIGQEVALSSPWGLCLHGGVLYIALAGCHQIWKMGLESRFVEPFCGSGREGLDDGPPRLATLAQPSGLTCNGQVLYVADSEASAIRAVELTGRAGWVTTLVGRGLFEFGDRDGEPGLAQLQHPLDVEAVEGMVFIADTFNHKLKVLDLENLRVRTVSGAGQAGWVDGAEARFFEPGGLSAAGGKIYIADTNNHRIRVVDRATGEVSTLEIEIPAA